MRVVVAQVLVVPGELDERGAGDVLGDVPALGDRLDPVAAECITSVGAWIAESTCRTSVSRYIRSAATAASWVSECRISRPYPRTTSSSSRCEGITSWAK